MFLVPLLWLQSAPLSKTVIVVASLMFVLAIALLVYFVRKLRASSKTRSTRIRPSQLVSINSNREVDMKT